MSVIRYRIVAEPSSVDIFARHLAQLLSIADLIGRLQPPSDEAVAIRDVTLLARASTKAERASLFQIENADASSLEPLWVMRLARSCEAEDRVEPVAAFYPDHIALLLAPMQNGAVEALGPLSGDEPFYRQHLHHEPLVPRFAALAPVLVSGRAVGVLEVARSDSAFSSCELEYLETAARNVAAAVYGTRREHSIQAMFMALLPELLEPENAMTSLPERLRHWLTNRQMAPEERRIISLATTIVEISSASPVAMEMVQSILSAARKAFVDRKVGSWSEVHHAYR